jgi:hypothetical protein
MIYCSDSGEEDEEDEDENGNIGGLLRDLLRPTAVRF